LVFPPPNPPRNPTQFFGTSRPPLVDPSEPSYSHPSTFKMLQLTAVTLGLSSLAMAHMQPGVHRAHDGFVKRRAGLDKRES